MRYTVKTPDGDMEYGGLDQLKEAYKVGLVKPEDEVRPEGRAVFQRAETIPGIIQKVVYRPGGDAAAESPGIKLTLLGMAIAIGGVLCLELEHLLVLVSHGWPSVRPGVSMTGFSPGPLLRPLEISPWVLLVACIYFLLFVSGLFTWRWLTALFFAGVAAYFFDTGRGLVGILLSVCAVAMIIASLSAFRRRRMDRRRAT